MISLANSIEYITAHTWAMKASITSSSDSEEHSQEKKLQTTEDERKTGLSVI